MTSTIHQDHLLEWLRSPRNKTFFNEDLVTLKASPIGGLGVFARKAVKPDLKNQQNNLLLRVPKISLLSAKNSMISNLLYDAGLNGMSALVIAFIYEKSIGLESPWFEYINSINLKTTVKGKEGQYILPPPFWPESDRNSLRGTEAEILGVLEKDEIEHHYTEALAFSESCLKDGLPIPYEFKISLDDSKEENELKFHAFASITLAIASRAFSIDAYHELALVPGADLFNHAIDGEENVHFEALGDVCPFCGKADGCGHNEYGAPDSEEEEEEESDEGEIGQLDKVDDEWEDVSERELESESDEESHAGHAYSHDEAPEEESLTEITMEYLNKVAKQVEEEEAAEQEESDEDMSDIGDDVSNYSDYDPRELMLDPDECVDIVLQTTVRKGDEIFNTYGELSNSLLLARYGFTVENNPSDYVSLGKQILKYKKQNKPMLGRLEWWTESGYGAFKTITREAESNGHDHDDCSCCGSDDESDYEYEIDEESWLLASKVLYPGAISDDLYAVAKLLTLSDEEYSRLSNFESPTLVESLIEQDKVTNKLILSWLEDRLNDYTDKKLRSIDYKKMLKKNGGSEIKRMINILLMSEKSIIEKTISYLKKRV